MKKGKIVKVIKRCYYSGHEKRSHHCTTNNIINILGEIRYKLSIDKEVCNYGIDVMFSERLHGIYIMYGSKMPTHGLWMKEECLTPATDREMFLFYTHGSKALK